jgi:hypothetical protein
MEKQRDSEVEGTIALRVWTYPEAVAALPYLRSVVRSLREHWLDWQQARLRVRRIDARPGRPGREVLLLRAEAGRDAKRAEERFEETLDELLALDVACLDPAKGLALIPFRQVDALAWFVFDLFAPRGLEAWRFHADPLPTRRPLAELLDTSVVDRVFSQSLDFGNVA